MMTFSSLSLFTSRSCRATPAATHHAMARCARLLRRMRFAAATGLLSLAWLAPVQAQAVAPAPAPGANADEQRLLDQGRSLAIAADCMACHTMTNGGKPYAGGYAIHSPLGTIYATNITPSKTGGIGNYSESEFASALRQGIRKDGSRLYPAMPYTSYTLLTDSDVHALYTYFMKGVKPVDDVPQRTELPFPFNIRASMIGWNMLFLDDKRFVPDPSKTQEINRGDYLTRALAHCSACHTPRNALMAEDNSRAFGGGEVGPWYAPNISSDPVAGIGAWTDDELVQYLHVGRVAHKAQAAGGMAEAVENSLQYLPESDLRAIVAYLRTTPPIRDKADDAAPRFAMGKPVSTEGQLRGTEALNANNTILSGVALFNGYCISCHQANGAGSTNQAYPSLFRNSATGAARADNLVSTILFGVDRHVGNDHVLMPRFDERSYVGPLSNEQVATVANYVLTTYGNAKAVVTPQDVQIAREGGRLPLLAEIQPYIVPAIVVGVVLVLLLLALILWRRRARTSPQA